MNSKNNLSDRTWPLPKRSHAMRMDWHDLLFMHWPVEASEIDRLLPGISCETYEGRAWIGVVPFRMSNVAPRFVPSLPWLSAFPELNIRTYINIDGKPGVWFFSLEATNKIAVRIARKFFHLPYRDAKISIRSRDNWFDYESKRIHRNESPANFKASYRPVGDPFHAQPGTLEHWLTARYCLYTCDHRNKILRGEIDHAPWLLQRAESITETNTMLDWLSLKVSGPPHLLFAQKTSVVAWLNQGLSS